MSENRVKDILGTDYPVIQGPMSGISEPNLVGAVSEAGGLGVLYGGINDIENAIKETKKLTDKPFAINILTDNFPVEDLKEQITLAFQHDVNHFVIIGSLNKEVINYIKEKKGVVIFREMAPSVKGAIEAEELGVDLIVATSDDEGGGIPGQGQGMFAILPAIVDAVEIPVLAAGCIVDSRSAHAAAVLGAEGIFCGTAFLLSEECIIPDNVKQAIIEHRGEDLIDIKVQGVNFRTIPTSMIKKELKEKPNQTPEYDFSVLVKGMVEGDLDNGIITTDMAIDHLTKIQSTADIVQGLVTGTPFE